MVIATLTGIDVPKHTDDRRPEKRVLFLLLLESAGFDVLRVHFDRQRWLTCCFVGRLIVRLRLLPHVVRLILQVRLLIADVLEDRLFSVLLSHFFLRFDLFPVLDDLALIRHVALLILFAFLLFVFLLVLLLVAHFDRILDQIVELLTIGLVLFTGLVLLFAADLDQALLLQELKRRFCPRLVRLLLGS